MVNRILVILILLLPLTSCMQTMMTENHREHNSHASSRILKDVTKDDLTLSVTIEPMIVETESAIIVSVSSTSVLSDSIDVQYMISKKSGDTESSVHNHSSSSTSSANFSTIHANGTVRNGKLSIQFTPMVTGEFIFSAEINNITTDVPFTVAEEKSSGMGDMMGVSSEYWYLGAAAMVGMMLVMWTVRGGIF